ncbi:Kelch repeat-containing protein [Pontibacter russatus]|uniref:Kelch repeat-containing protein n=1 Tax=Pontibacter russatus TaxID=2694929 RepID=UPI00137A5920|nr:kelch repeat-containing protein [Pontibacter russatus]
MAASAPAFTAARYAFSISDAATLGAAAGRVEATDADGGAPVYAITAGNTNGAFAMNTATGTVTVAKYLNYHTQDTYNLTVRATDGSGLYSEAAVVVKVTAGNSPSDFADITWGTTAGLPYGTHEVHGTVVNGKLYIFGGYDVQKQPSWTPTKRSYVYDPATNKWSAIADLPHTPKGTNFGGITHVGLDTDGTDIYFAGGYTSNSSGTGQIFGTRQAWKYNVATNTYTALPSLPVELAAGQLRYLQGKLHYIGGANKLRQDIADHYVLDLDNLSAGWKASVPLSNPRNHPGSIVCEGKLYFIGGAHHQDEQTVTQKSVEVYNPGTNSWSFVADLPTAVDHISSSVVVMGRRILVLGGETSHNNKTNKIQAYSPATNSWTTISPLAVSKAAGVAAVLDGNLYYSGGNFARTTYKGVPGVTEAQQQVSSLTLYDANTKQAIQTLTGGATLNLATLPSRKLNIRANTSPSKVGSVVFALSGAQSRNATESIAPYDLMGDDGAWTPSVGSYSLKATPYTSSGGGGTAGTALTVAFTVVDQEPDTNNPLISNIKATSGRSYVLADLAVGVRAYTDRTYEVTSVPASLAGAALVRTANDDKHSSASALLSFELSESATVYVAYDPRATALPSWLSGWQKLTDRIGVDDSKISHMDLYSKTFAAGAVSLGGNKQSPAAGAENNYFVVGKAAQASSTNLISNVSASSGRNYVLGELATGVTHYTDRTYKVTSAPAFLGGAPFIRTANDDKYSTASTLLSFELSEGATVYVAYDPRATALPSWLSGWQKLTDRIGINDSKISHMDLYSKTFAAGAVSLGGNKQSPAAGAENNYFVIARAAQATLLSDASSNEATTLLKTESNGLALTVYPNPTSGGQVFVKAANFGSQETVTLSLHDVLGRIIASVDAVTDQQGFVRVEVPGHTQLKRGMYIIRASAAGGKAQSKLLVR